MKQKLGKSHATSGVAMGDQGRARPRAHPNSATVGLGIRIDSKTFLGSGRVGVEMGLADSALHLQVHTIYCVLPKNT